MSFWKRRGVHIITEQEQECLDLSQGLSNRGYCTAEDLSDHIRLATGRTYSPAKVLEIAKYYARVLENRANEYPEYTFCLIDIWYHAGVEEQTLIRSVDPYRLAREIDEAMGDLRAALQEVRAKKAP